MLPLAGGCTVAVDGETFVLEGRDDVFSALTDFLYVPRDARVEVASDGGGRFALTSSRADRRLRGAPRRRRPSRGRAARRGPGEPPGQQLLRAGRRSRADRLIAVEVLTPGGELVLVPAAQARRGRAGRRDGARGDLLLRGRPARRRPGFAYQRVYGSGPGREIDVTAEVAQRRRDRHAARLPRPVDGRARLRPLLPQRDGGAGRARVALHRRPGPRLDPGDLGGPGPRPAAAADRAPAGRTA